MYSTVASQRAIHGANNFTAAFIRKNIHIGTTTSSQIISKSNHLIRHRLLTFNIPTALAIASSDDRSIDYFLPYPSRHGYHLQSKRYSNATQCASSDDNLQSNTIEMVVLHNDDRKIIRRIIRSIQSWANTLWDAVLVLMRTSEVAVRLSPLIILTPMAMILTPSRSLISTSCHESHNHDHSHSSVDKISIGSHPRSRSSDLAWKYATYTIQKLGPVFIKLAQWAATRRDTFPESTCDRLSELHSSTTVHSWGHTRRILNEGGFRDWKEGGIIRGEGEGVVLKVDKEDILGSGCVAQVYRGTLVGNGGSKEMDVAVKVLHPNMLERTERDLLLIKRMANVLDSLPFESIKMLSLPRAIDNFSTILANQVDLCVEGKNLHRFRSNFFITNNDDNEYNSSGSKISFPKPLLIKPDCLVEQLVTDNEYNGSIVHPITDLIADTSERGMKIRREVAGVVLRSFLKMIFIDNFVHCDLHPGNVLVRRQRMNKLSTKSSEKEEYTIIFLDAGIVTSLEPRDQQNLKDLFRAVVLNDGHTAGRLMVERARYQRCTEIPGGVEAFSDGIASIVTEFHDRRKKGLTLGIVGIGTLLTRVLGLCREYAVEIDPAMANVVMSTLVLEGLGRSLDEDLNLIECAIPFILGGGKI